MIYWCGELFLLALLACYLLVRYPAGLLMDHSGERSLHQGKTPRSGGTAIVFALFISVLFFYSGYRDLISESVLWALLLLCVVSFVDDIKQLHPVVRLIAQFFVAAIIVWQGQLFFLIEGWSLISHTITFFAIVWMINLYNFMDGMDGFAGGMALFGFSIFSILGLLANDLNFVWGNLFIVSAVSGFFCWNLPPAKIFMGDLGSTLLGALAAIMALVGMQRDIFPLWVPVLIFSPFWVDASYTLLRRIMKREKVWQAHRSHFYQRLVLSGLTHRQVVLGEYALMGLCGLTTVLPPLVGVDYNLYPPIVWGGIYLLVIAFLEDYLVPKVGVGR